MRVAVLGAGLQGACIALELARRGVDVDLCDQDDVPVNRASLRNEGKVHLGLVYANDPSFATAASMLEGALRFGPLLERWIGARFADIGLARPFHYLVANDSLLGADRLAAHYDAVDARCRERLADDRSLHYVGTRPDCLYRPLDRAELRDVASPATVACGFATAELAIDLPAMAAGVRAALSAEPKITFRGGHTVAEVERTSSGFRVEGTSAGDAWSLESDQVVNASWTSRLAIDATAGIRTERPWVHRLKFRLLVDLPHAIRNRPSVTFVLGPYGDVVVYPSGVGYVSWYPVCMRGWSEQLSPPDAWDAACRGEPAADEAQEVAQQALAEIDAWYPGLAAARTRTVDAGVIFAWGATDISDCASELHRRDETGVASVDGYHSVNTGKLTTAPRHALVAADAVAPLAR